MAMETPAVDVSWRDKKLLSGVSSTSSDVLDPCLMNNHPLASISNTENKNISPVGINHQKEFLSLTRQEYMEKIRELNDRLDMVKNIARPGCSYELLNTALCYMSSLVTILSEMPQKLHASL
uniref:uncharacterized protein LOC122596448 isoform X2 n=1 Tax=Erigeron canadensis TaxID=72917 RepID=UPI001CB88E25|nr:uncharacterized protein LOC122596448 isoform X2 [Erigeron canadensis]